jgi:hypothetical protein
MSPTKPRDAVLRLMGVLERCLRALAADQSTPFHKQVEAHRDAFSDIAGITDARRVRNSLAHGEDLSDSRAAEAQAVLKQALAEILPHCPKRLRAVICEVTVSEPGVVKSRPVPIQSRTEPPVPLDVLNPSLDSGLPACDWVYFATPSKEVWAITRAIVSELGMIVRSVYNNGNPPIAIANVRNIRLGQRILLVYGGRGEPYRAMFSCTVVAPRRPVPQFEVFSFADDVQNECLTRSGYSVDPHLNRFTGISVEISPEHLTGFVRKPLGNNTIRSWKEVESYNAG